MLHIVVVSAAVGGVDYPRTQGEFMAWFADEAACVRYLERLRWGDGFRVPGVRADAIVAASRGVGARVCAACAKRTSVTAGTVFAGTRSPLTPLVRGRVARVRNEEPGQRAGAANAAWAGQLRDGLGVAAQAPPGHGRSRARAAVGDRRGRRDHRGRWWTPPTKGRRIGKKALVAVAVESDGGRAGRVRLAGIRDASPLSVRVG